MWAVAFYVLMLWLHLEGTVGAGPLPPVEASRRCSNTDMRQAFSGSSNSPWCGRAHLAARTVGLGVSSGDGHDPGVEGILPGAVPGC